MAAAPAAVGLLPPPPEPGGRGTERGAASAAEAEVRVAVDDGTRLLVATRDVARVRVRWWPWSEGTVVGREDVVVDVDRRSPGRDHLFFHDLATRSTFEVRAVKSSHLDARLGALGWTVCDLAHEAVWGTILGRPTDPIPGAAPTTSTVSCDLSALPPPPRPGVDHGSRRRAVGIAVIWEVLGRMLDAALDADWD